MTDVYGNKLQVGDTLTTLWSDSLFVRGTNWVVLDFGIEASTNKKICVIKNKEKNYIMCAYQSELNYFRKENKNDC